MALTSSNIKLRQSERMTDFSDGGGQMSATQVIDGVLDNIFSDRSELDAIYGRTSLRKVYTQVDSTNTDTYLGAFAFITDPPADGNVSVTMFDTGSWSDLRSDAQTYVENYRIESVRSQFTLYGNHIPGLQTVQVYCHDKTIISPDIGDVLELSIEASGYAPLKQFVKVDQVLSRQTITFEDNSGPFQRDVIIIQITTSLLYNFPGMDPPQRLTASPPTIVRFTQLAASSAYYGISPLALSASVSDRTVKVVSPFVHVVPSSQSENPISDVLAGQGSVTMVVSGAANSLSISAASGSLAAGATLALYFGTPFARKSLAITIGGATLADDGIGNIASTVVGDTSWSGSADYATGSFTISKNVAWSGTVNATATPAGAVDAQTYTQKIAITGANRQFSYVTQLPSAPSVGSVIIDYLALGKWIRLTDQGNGSVSGNPGEGAGTINYATGSINLTLGSFPDNASNIIFYWSTDLRVRDVHGEITVPTPTYRQQLAHAGSMPGTCSITWTSASVSKSASVSSAGVISGDATGQWNFAQSVVDFSTTAFPDAGFTYAYSYIDPSKIHTETFNPTASGGEVSITLAHAPVQAGSVNAQWSTLPYQNLGGIDTIHLWHAQDDTSGHWKVSPPGLVNPTGSGFGTNSVNYTTGACVLPVENPYNLGIPQYSYTTVGSWTYSTLTGYTNLPITSVFAAGSPVVVTYCEAGVTPTSTSETHASPPITLLLSAGSTGAAVPGSIRLIYRGRTYVDRAGSLYYGISPTTNAGTLGGSYDYANNIATITDYTGTGNTVTIASMLTRYVTTGVSTSYFRTPGSPLKTGSFVWRYADMLGTEYTGTTDINGNITGTGAKGLVSWDNGTVTMYFGTYVTAAGNESQPWYDAANVVGSTVWKPTIIDPSTLFIGTVVYKYVPLSPAILGLDPVRLPSDGRVLGFQTGGVVAVHNTQITSVTSPTAGGVTNLGRPRISFAEVKDSLGVAIDPVWYIADLDAGTITWANPLNLSAYTLPVKIRHRIEDISVCNDIQITGELGLQAALTHDFPSSGSYASACLIYGDMQARMTNLFDQQLWTGVFSDVLIGSPATASYNNVVYPITVQNGSVTQDRWAFVFQSTSTVSVIGEIAGNLGTFPIASDIAPINPVSGQPYFTIHAAGWGSGWAAGNVLRGNSIAATRPTWLLRCTLQGPITALTDQFRLQIYGDAA